MEKQKTPIQKQIDKLIPYLSENFITYPLWEEGKYIPFVNFWQICRTQNEIQVLDKNLQKVFENSGYVVQYNDCNFDGTILEYSVYPNYDDLDDGSYKFVKKDWSIEEMLDLLEIALK